MQKPQDAAQKTVDAAQIPPGAVQMPPGAAQMPTDAAREYPDAASVAKAPADRAASALANSTAQTASPISAVDAPVFSWSGYFEAIGLLFLILALLWLGVYVLRKHGKFRFMPSPGNFPRDGLQVEAQLPLGPRKGLVVVRFLDKRLLLGVTDQQITMLSEGMTDHADVGRKFEELIREADSQ